MHIGTILTGQGTKTIFWALLSGSILVGCDEVSQVEQPGPKVELGISEATIFSPEPLSICDREAGFCADDWGVSMEHTREFLGVAAEAEFMAAAKASGFDRFDGTRFTFSSGVYCSVDTNSCLESKDSETPALNYSNILFAQPDR